MSSKHIDTPKYKFELDDRSCKKIVLDEIEKHLKNKEYIIRKVFENDSTSYNVCYISNRCNILYAGYNKRSSSFEIKILRCNNDEELNEIQLKAMISYKFKSNHYSRLKKEIIDVMDLFKAIQ